MFISTKRFRTISRIGAATLLVLLFLCTSGRSTTIQCERLERNYINCEQQRSSFFGLLADSPVSFRLVGAKLEKYSYEDSEGVRHDAYKLQLQTPAYPIEFYDYSTKFRSAEADQKRFLSLLNGSEATSFQLKRNFFGRDIFFMILMSICFIPFVAYSPLLVAMLLSIPLTLLKKMKLSMGRFFRMNYR